jgi:hypothetical protein
MDAVAEPPSPANATCTTPVIMPSAPHGVKRSVEDADFTHYCGNGWTCPNDLVADATTKCTECETSLCASCGQQRLCTVCWNAQLAAFRLVSASAAESPGPLVIPDGPLPTTTSTTCSVTIKSRKFRKFNKFARSQLGAVPSLAVFSSSDAFRQELNDARFRFDWDDEPLPADAFDFDCEMPVADNSFLLDGLYE